MRRRSIYRQFLLAFLAVGAIPVLVGVVQYRSAHSLTVELVGESNASILSLGRQVLHRHLREIEALVVDLANDTIIRRPVEAAAPLDGPTPVRILEASNRLVGSYPDSDLLHALWVYYPTLDAIAGTDRNYPRLQEVWGDTYDVHGYSYDEFRDLVLMSRRAGELRPAVSVRNDQRVTRVLPYVRSSQGAGGSGATIIALLDVRDVLEIFAPLHSTPGSFFAMIDAQGELVVASDGTPPLPALREIPHETGSRAVRARVLGTDMLVFQAESDGPIPFRMLSALPTRAAMEPFLRAARISGVALIAALLGHAVFSFLLSRKMAQPVVQVIDRLHPHLGLEAPERTPSYEYLNSLLDRSFAHTRDLELRLQQQRDNLGTTFLDLLLRGTLREEDVPARVAPAIGVFGGRRYRVVLCQLEPTDRDAPLIERGVVYVQSEFEHLPHARTFNPRPYLVGCVVLGIRSDDDPAEPIRRVASRIASEVAEMEDIHGAIAVGGEVPTAWEIHRSYEEALSILDEDSGRADGTVLWYDEIEPDTRGYVLTTSSVVSLTRAVRTGRTDDIVQIFETVRRVNFDRRRIGMDAAALLMRELWVNLAKTAQRLDLDGASSDPVLAGRPTPDIPARIAVLPPIEQLSAVEECYLSLARSTVSRGAEVRSTVVADAKQYLDEKYTDPNVTLSSVADALGVSPEHLSRMFSRVEKSTFHVYLTLLRVRKAKALISVAPERAATVYADVGYSNRATFRRAFQAYEGVTAAQFARAMRGATAIKDR